MKSFFRRFRKVFKITGISIAGVLLLMFLLPVIFPGFVNDKIKQWSNSAIKGELDFSKVRLSFFNHFPSLTLTLYDVTLKGSAPFQKDTLAAVKEIALGVNLSSLFKNALTIDEIYLTKGKIHILADKEGRPNYNIYVADSSAAKSQDTSSASLKLERIQIEDCALKYDDRSIPFLLSADKLNYLGKGDLSKAIFDLSSDIEMEGLTINYNGQPYLENKSLNTDLVAKINTNSLSLFFEDENFRINQLPLKFKGRFEFLKNGYDMDFRFNTDKTDFKNFFTALPPAFVKWVEKRKVRGEMMMNASLTGKHIVSENIAPSVAFDMKVTDGFFNAKKAKDPARNFLFDFHFRLPQLNMDSMRVDVDSVNLAIGERFLRGAIHTKGLNKLYVDSRLQGMIDIEKFNRIFGSPDSLALRGMYEFNARAKGVYAMGQNPKRLRPDTVIVSVPAFSLQSSLKDGYLKYYSLPQALHNISFDLDAACNDNDYRHASLKIDNLNAAVLNNFIKGFLHINGVEKFLIDTELKTKFNLADISSFYPLENIDLKGQADIDIASKGVYNADQHIFPVTNALINIKNGTLKTPYYPAPVTDIQVEAEIKSKNGSMKDLQVNLKPVSLQFEGKPFVITSDLNDFENIVYNVTSHGSLDLGKIYKVFGISGYDVNGTLQADFSLQGSQADAMAGNYSRLNNKGTLRMENVTVIADLFPKPFKVESGAFHFDNDKMIVDDLKINYGSTDAVLKGYFSNIIEYGIKDSAVLKGILEFSSPYLNADELTAFSGSATDSTAKPDTSAGSGVIMIPANLDVEFAANVGKVSFNGLSFADCKATVLMKDGSLVLNNTGFTIIDAPVKMDATYKSLSPLNAMFKYHITAKQFDIKKAYNEITLFREMATSAASAEGIVSLDYTLDGVLDKNMYPIMPSLKGGGTLSLQKVKIKGLKLVSAVSKATNKDSLDNPDLSKVDIKTKIANNILTIERTKMRIFGFRPRFEGQVGLDGKLNLKGRIGLPPFGIFGIPFVVSGSQEDPIVRLRKGKNGEQLEEQEYDEEDLKDSQQAVPPPEEKKEK